MTAIDTTSPSDLKKLNLVERIDLKLIETSRPILEKPAVRKFGQIGKAGDDKILLMLSAGIILAGLASRNGKLQRTGSRMLIAQIVAKATKEAGKSSVDRTRPSKQIESGRYAAKAGNSKATELRSFPSGHTASALSVARAFSREYPKYTKPVLTAAAVIGFLQIPRRANYPGDVAAGAGAGLVAEKIADRLVSTYHKLRGSRARKAKHRALPKLRSLRPRLLR